VQNAAKDGDENSPPTSNQRIAKASPIPASPRIREVTPDQFGRSYVIGGQGGLGHPAMTETK
jgi:hypothetical protein